MVVSSKYGRAVERSPLKTSFLQGKQAQVPQSFFIGEALQPSEHFCSPPAIASSWYRNWYYVISKYTCIWNTVQTETFSAKHFQNCFAAAAAASGDSLLKCIDLVKGTVVRQTDLIWYKHVWWRRVEQRTKVHAANMGWSKQQGKLTQERSNELLWTEVELSQ